MFQNNFMQLYAQLYAPKKKTTLCAKKNNFMFQVCYVTSEFSKHIRVNENLFVWALTGVVYSNLLYRLPTSRLSLAFGVQKFLVGIYTVMYA